MGDRKTASRHSKSRSDAYTLAQLGQLGANLNRNKELVTQEDLEIRKEVFRLQKEAHKVLSRYRQLQRDRVAERRRIAMLAQLLRVEYERNEAEYKAIPQARRAANPDGCDGNRAEYLRKWLARARVTLEYADRLGDLLDKQITTCSLQKAVASDDDRDSSSGTSDSDSDSDSEGDDDDDAASYFGGVVTSFMTGSGSTSAGASAAAAKMCPCACNPCRCIEKGGVCHCPKPKAAAKTKAAPRVRGGGGGVRIARDGYEYPRADEIGGGVLTGKRQRRRARVGKLNAGGALARLSNQLRHARTTLKTLCEDDYLVCICGKYYDLHDVDPCILETFVGK